MDLTDCRSDHPSRRPLLAQGAQPPWAAGSKPARETSSTRQRVVTEWLALSAQMKRCTGRYLQLGLRCEEGRSFKDLSLLAEFSVLPSRARAGGLSPSELRPLLRPPSTSAWATQLRKV